MEHEQEQREILKWLLGQIYRADKRKKQLDQRLMAIADKLNAPIGAIGYSPLPGSHCGGDGAASILLKMSDIEERIYSQKDELEKSYVRVMDILDYLPSESMEREICEMRHIDMLGWKDIQVSIPMSHSQCHKRYNMALDKLLESKRVAKLVDDNRDAWLEWRVYTETRRLKNAPEIQGGGYTPENDSGKISGKKKRKPRPRA